jgi:hypothetical protein
MANYVQPTLDRPPTQDEAEVLKNLSRAGKRLIGFCRTNLFKRLESSGSSFLLSIQRHIIRNFIYLHAIESGKPLPIGTQDAALFDTREDDLDADTSTTPADFFDGEGNHTNHVLRLSDCKSIEDLRQQAVAGYQFLSQHYQTRFDWLRPTLFVDDLAQHLNQDADRLFSILKLAGPWQAENDAKLAELHKLLTKKHRTEKVLVFTQFADTVAYLEEQLRALGAREMAAVTGETEDPSSYARRFSPVSNQAREKITPVEELRILVATDVLSEGQNLQDAAIVVNYDLPWAIIRLIQRAGRVDRIGQRSEKILCYSFLPADGVERLIRLRSRVRQRLHENAEVVGTDETFFEDEKQDQVMRDLFTEKSGILEDPDDTEVDLASQAYQIWKNATDLNPTLKKTIPDLPNVIFSTKPLSAIRSQPERAGAVKPTTGVMVYIRNLRRL